MRPQLYHALASATAGEFHLLEELDCEPGWIAYLASAAQDGSLAVLLLQHAEEDQFDLRVVKALDGSLRVGKTTCAACGATADGWPRFCGACRRDLSGVAPDVAIPGGSEQELLDAVREAAAGVYHVLGALPHADGGGTMFIAREAATHHVVGLVLELDGGEELGLVRSWAADHEALASLPDVAAEPTVPPAVPLSPEPHHASPPFSLERHEGPTAPEPEVAPAALTAPDVAALLYADERPHSARRRPVRRIVYGAAGAMLVAAGVVLALVIVQRQQPAPGVADRSIANFSSIPPAPATPSATAPLLPAFDDSLAATPVPDPVSKGVSEKAAPSSARPRQRRQSPREQPREPAPAAPPASPSPELDRQRVLDAVARYTEAVESQQMDRVRAAYPEISSGEANDLARWFHRINSLRVTPSVAAGPEVHGDSATVTVNLEWAYDRQRHWDSRRATLRRAGDGWIIQRLNRLP